MNDLDQACWNLVATLGRPIATKECYRKLKPHLSSLSEIDVAEALGGLAKQGAIKLNPSRKWILQKSPPASITPLSSSYPPPRSSPINLNTSTQIGGSDNDPSPRSPLISKTQERSGRWAQFRILIYYYLDCI